MVLSLSHTIKPLVKVWNDFFSYWNSSITTGSMPMGGIFYLRVRTEPFVSFPSSRSITINHWIFRYCFSASVFIFFNQLVLFSDYFFYWLVSYSFLYVLFMFYEQDQQSRELSQRHVSKRAKKLKVKVRVRVNFNSFHCMCMLFAVTAESWSN